MKNNTTWTVKNNGEEYLFVVRENGVATLAWREFDKNDAGDVLSDLVDGADTEWLEENKIIINLIDEDLTVEEIEEEWDSLPVIADETGLKFDIAAGDEYAEHALKFALIQTDRAAALEACETAWDVMTLVEEFAATEAFGDAEPIVVFEDCMARILELAEISTVDFAEAVGSVGDNLHVLNGCSVEFFDEDGNPTNEGAAEKMEVTITFFESNPWRHQAENALDYFKTSEWEAGDVENDTDRITKVFNRAK